MREVAEGELLPRFRCLASEEIWEKERGGTVTVADMESERRLVAALTDLVPGSVALGEEDAHANPAAFDRLNEDAPVWIVDPLDGTKNFAAGEDSFAMIVAFFHKGAARAGWILAPISDRLVMAQEGAGAWSGDRPLRVRTGDPVGRMSGSLGTRLRRNAALLENFGTVTNLGCCGIEYMSLADGDLHFAHYRRLKPWDHAAGDLIVREAGGHAAGLDSEARYQPASPDYNGLLLAGDRESWDEVAALLRPAVAALG
jgi:fructose-1,6-bisphosphatase/inositol monophosphatase family enzyme